MSLNFGFNVSVRSGHQRHPYLIPKILMGKKCTHFFGPLCVYIYSAFVGLDNKKPYLIY